MTAYEQGFLKKCAEYGLDAETAGKLMKAAAHWSAHLVPWTTDSERQEQLANAAYYSQLAQRQADYFGRGDPVGKSQARDLLHASNASLLGGSNTKAFKRYMELQQPHIRAEQEAYAASHPAPSPVQAKPVEKAPTTATTTTDPVQPSRRSSGVAADWNPYAARYRGIDRLMDNLANNRKL